MRIATYTTRAFIGLGLLLAVGLLLEADGCEKARREPFAGDPLFRVSQPSRLYFANVRANSYYFERPRGTDLELYRLRRFTKTGKRPTLTPVIVQAYLKDEAYVFVRPNDYPGIGPELAVDFRGRDTSGTHRLAVPSKPNQVAFAEDLRRSISRGDSLYLHLAGDERAPIYQTRAERGLFLTVMRDYDALTDK